MGRILWLPPLVAAIPVAILLADYGRPDVIALPGMAEAIALLALVPAYAFANLAVVVPTLYAITRHTRAPAALATASLGLAAGACYAALALGFHERRAPKLPNLLDVELLNLFGVGGLLLAGSAAALMRSWRGARGDALRPLGVPVRWVVAALGAGGLAVAVAAHVARREPAPVGVADAAEPLPGEPFVQRAVAVAVLGDLATALADKPGGLVCARAFAPSAWLAEMRAFERGALREIAAFAPLLRAPFGAGPDALVDVLATGPELCSQSEASGLLESAGADLHALAESIAGDDPLAPPRYAPLRRMPGWLEDAFAPDPRFDPAYSAQLRLQLLTEDDPEPPTLVVRHLLDLRTALPERRGQRWVLSALLAALQHDVASELQRNGAWSDFQTLRDRLSAADLDAPTSALLDIAELRALARALSDAETLRVAVAEQLLALRRKLRPSR